MKPLSNDTLKNINGGYVVCSWGMKDFREDAPWQVIDDETGKTLSHCLSYDDAVVTAKSYGVASHLVGQDFVENLRDWRDY